MNEPKHKSVGLGSRARSTDYPTAVEVYLVLSKQTKTSVLK